MTSSSTARAGGSSPSEATGRPVSISPPSEREVATPCASAIACEPPHGHGPADGVREHHEEEGERPRARRRERPHRVGRVPRQERAGGRLVEPAPGEPGRRAQAERREPRRPAAGAAAGRSGGPSRTSGERRPVAHERADQALGRRGRRRRGRPPSRRPTGAARPRRRRRAGAPAAGRGAPPRGRAPRAGSDDRNGEPSSERVHRRAHVVEMPGQRELLGARAAADRRRALEHAHRAAGLGERDRRRQPVRAGADDDRVELWVRHAGTAWPRTSWEPSPCTYPNGCPRCARRSPPSTTGAAGRRTPSSVVTSPVDAEAPPRATAGCAPSGGPPGGARRSVIPIS